MIGSSKDRFAIYHTYVFMRRDLMTSEQGMPGVHHGSSS